MDAPGGKISTRFFTTKTSVHRTLSDVEKFGYALHELNFLSGGGGELNGDFGKKPHTQSVLLQHTRNNQQHPSQEQSAARTNNIMTRPHLELDEKAVQHLTRVRGEVALKLGEDVLVVAFAFKRVHATHRQQSGREKEKDGGMKKTARACPVPRDSRTRQDQHGKK